MSAVRYRFRAELRLSLVVQCQRPSAKLGEVVRADTGSRATAEDLSCTQRVAPLPAVAATSTVLDHPGYVETADRVSLDPDRNDPCYSGRGEVSLVSDPTGRTGTSFNATRVVAGRRARPGAADEMDDVPSLLGALMALMASAVLAHVLVSGLGQHRRDLALLRTLGFTRGQVSRTVGWQASTCALVTLAVSVPLGVIVGRAIWRSYAESIGVVPEPVTPWGTLAAVAVAAFVIANIIAAAPAHRATRVAPAAILRTE